MAPAAGTNSFKPHCGRAGLSRTAWNTSHSEANPLSGGSAEMATQPPKKKERRFRHLVDETAELFDVARARGGEDRARPEEQQALEERMVESMKQRRGERERCRLHPCRLP